MNDHPRIEKDAKELIASFGKALPETVSAFSQLQKVTFEDGALDAKTKELIALAIATSQGCDGCMAWHNSALQRLGASREEVADALGVAVEMGGGIALYSAAKALEGYEQFLAR